MMIVAVIANRNILAATPSSNEMRFPILHILICTMAEPMMRAVMDGCEYTLTSKCYATHGADFSTAWPSIGMAGTGKSHLGCYTRRGWRAFFKYP